MLNLKNKKCAVIVLQSYDPFLNLAIEQYYFNNIKAGDYLLLLWQSAPSLILGRFQNPWKEVNTKKMKEDDVTLVRRFSGGGCVYHDLGNLNYCFISNEEKWQRHEHCEFILNSISDFAIKGNVTEKFDIHLETESGDKKVSGSAFKQSRTRKLHHGTLLINSDLNRLRRYLKMDKKLITTKAIDSRPKSVVNICEINKDLTVAVVKNKIIKEFSNLSDDQISTQFVGFEMLNNPEVLERYQYLSGQKWLLGETPRFVQTIDFKLDWGTGSVKITSEKALITDIEIEGGYFHPEIVTSIKQASQNLEFDSTQLKNALLIVIEKYSTYTNELSELTELLSENIS